MINPLFLFFFPSLSLHSSLFYPILNHVNIIEIFSMKELEVQEQAVDASSPFIIRLDGVSFYTFTKGVTKPFDDRITRAMVKTAKDLLEK